MTQAKITRFSLSMPAELVSQLDEMVRAAGFANRSQAMAKLVRDGLVEYGAGRGQREIAGTVTLVYDHHKRNLQTRLTSIQHDFGGQIISTLHVHLDHNHCLEVLVVRGRFRQIKELANRLTTAKGVMFGKFTVAATEKALET